MSYYQLTKVDFARGNQLYLVKYTLHPTMLHMKIINLNEILFIYIYI